VSTVAKTEHKLDVSTLAQTEDK